MSIIGSNILAGAAGSGVSAYEIEQSLRFDATTGTGLTRTPSSNGNGQTFTWSAWIKKGKSNHNTSGADGLLGAGTNSFTLNFTANNDTLYFVQNSGATPQEQSVSKFRDSSAWMHIIFVADTTNATAADRTRVYINGERFTDWNAGNTNHATQNQTLQVNQTSEQQIGCHRDNNGITYEFYGYMAEVVMLDGTAVTDGSSFGEYDDNGVWRPIAISGLTFGTNGYYLTFDPSATNGIGHDHSGNGNNFTATGFTTSGTGTDVMSDTPTTNWCTLNPLDLGEFGAGITVSEGNLRAVSTSSDRHVRSTFFLPTSGKWYWEMTATTVNTAGYLATGLYHSTGSLTSSAIATAQGRWYAGDGYGNGNSWGATYDDGDIIGIAVDMDSGKIWAAKNNTWQASGDPAAGTNPMYSDLLTAYSPDGWSPVCANWQSGNTADFNFGQRAFEYTPPTGFKALNTSNLPAPDIADGSQYFNTVLYTGDNTEQAITGVGFQPDWVWVKCRNQSSTNHILQDAVRGAQKYITSDTNVVEGTSDGTIISFDSDGFTIGAGNPAVPVNNNGDTFVAWNWLGANGTSSNTTGSITSTVSANPTAGFSIVTYTSPNNTADQTVGHGLGVKPSLIMVKNRDNTYNWDVYHSSLGYNASLILSSPNATRSGAFGAEPTSTVFTTKTSYTHNGTQKYVAYCFAEVEGYSKFGTYSSNNNSDGPFVYLGFRPAFILIKDTGSNNWVLQDSERVTYNPVNKFVSPDNANGDASDAVIDFLSNGFKIRTNWSGINYTSGNTYTYAAFAENPFGGDGVSPATAR